MEAAKAVVVAMVPMIVATATLGARGDDSDGEGSGCNISKVVAMEVAMTRMLVINLAINKAFAILIAK